MSTATKQPYAGVLPDEQASEGRGVGDVPEQSIVNLNCVIQSMLSGGPLQ